MQERRLRTQEVVDLHERGGLTLAHWQEVVGKIGEPKNKTDQKLMDYAQKVISKDFPDSDSYHSEYLGHRHWLHLSFINTKDKIKTPRRLPPWPKISYIVNPTVVEIKSYAEAETRAAYTLDDYFDGVERKTILGRPSSPPPSSSICLDPTSLSIGDSWYSWNGESWVSSGWNTRLVDYYGQMEDSFFNNSPVYKLDEKVILSAFLLTHEEVPETSNKSPRELESIARNNVPEEVLNKRLRKYLSEKRKQFKLVGGWEKEI